MPHDMPKPPAHVVTAHVGDANTVDEPVFVTATIDLPPAKTVEFSGAVRVPKRDGVVTKLAPHATAAALAIGTAANLAVEPVMNALDEDTVRWVAGAGPDPFKDVKLVPKEDKPRFAEGNFGQAITSQKEQEGEKLR